MSTGIYSQLTNFIWSISNLLRGPYRRNKYCKVFDNAEFGVLKITIDLPLRLNFQVTPVRLETERGFIYFTTRNKKNKKYWLAVITKGEQHQAAVQKPLADFVGARGDTLYKDSKAFLTELREVDHAADLRLTSLEQKAVLSSLGHCGETAEICHDHNDNPVRPGAQHGECAAQ